MLKIVAMAVQVAAITGYGEAILWRLEQPTPIPWTLISQPDHFWRSTRPPFSLLKRTLHKSHQRKRCRHQPTCKNELAANGAHPSTAQNSQSRVVPISTTRHGGCEQSAESRRRVTNTPAANQQRPFLSSLPSPPLSLRFPYMAVGPPGKLHETPHGLPHRIRRRTRQLGRRR